MLNPDYYQILGVDEDASDAEIKRAFRRLALKYHPDRNRDNPEAEEHFRQVARAYEVLSDPVQRAVFDQLGHDGLGASHINMADIDAIFQEFGEIFGDMFGFGTHTQGGRGPSRGADLEYTLALSFKEAVFGTSKLIEIPRREACEGCGGSGAASDDDIFDCPTCRGQGQTRHTQGFFTVSSICKDCEGSGERIEAICQDCEGVGIFEQTREVRVKVPAGVESGNKLRLRGEGARGKRGGPRGDLIVFLEAGQSDIFERDGADLYYDASASFVEAALGFKLEVPTLNSPQAVVFAAGTQHGDSCVLKELGVARPDGSGRGDLIVRVALKTPTHLSPEQRRLLSEFARSAGLSARVEEKPPRRCPQSSDQTG